MITKIPKINQIQYKNKKNYKFCFLVAFYLQTSAQLDACVNVIPHIQVEKLRFRES